MTIDPKNIPPLKEPIAGRESFMHTGSVNAATKSRPQHFQKKDDTAEGISELVLKNKILPSTKVNKVYDEHVMMNKFNAIRLTRKDQRDSDGGTKIRIGPSSVTIREFVQALRPLGKMCLNLMWVCSNAIMRDWHSRTKLILDPTFILELTKNVKKCDHKSLAKRLAKYSLEDIEQIFLPTCKDNRLIAIVVNFTQNALEVYDSKSIVKEGEKRYKSLLKNMTTNLQKAYSQARRSESINIEEMKTYYNIAGIQDNPRDCGYYVLRVLQCHNGKELAGNCKISIDLFRKVICYALINHKFNDLNPNRPEILALREDEETTSK